MLEQGTDAKGSHDSEGRLHCSGLFLGVLQPTEGSMIAGEIQGGLFPMGGMPCCQKGSL